MPKIIRFLLCVWLFGCQSKSKNEMGAIEVDIETPEVLILSDVDETSIDSMKLGINFKPIGDYDSIVSRIRIDRTYFDRLYRTNATKALDSASKYIYSKLLNDIVPHWYGRPWDFNGHTNSPHTGDIACGYFVSTTLKHLGFNLNRYKMAQAAGMDEAKLLQSQSDIKIYSNLSFEQLKDKINHSYADGIYFVGLDNHVGYVFIKDKALYFLHSSYCDDKVVIESAETSPCFGSNIYVFAEISTNSDLIKKWIRNERLSVPTH